MSYLFTVTKKTVPSLQKANQALEAENAKLRQQLADAQIKQAELLQAAQAKPAAKTVPVDHAAMGHDMSHMGHDMSHMGHDMGAMGHDMGQMKMEPGDQFLFNPVLGGSEMFNAHPKGMWMFNAKWMHGQQDGLQDGNNPVSRNQVGPAVYPASVFGGGGSPYPSKYPYMMIPTHMTMDMFMFMGMYGVTDRLTLMAMLNYQTMNMPMLMDMGNQPEPYFMGYHSVSSSPPMATGGLGDTELDVIYKIHDSTLGKLTGTLGLSIPTGSTTQQIDMMGYGYRAPYDMQLGSGTVDFKPALTYNWISEDVLWNMGGQVSGVVHMGSNHGYSLGDSFKASIWGQRAFGPATTWLRLKYTDTAQIQGHDPQISCLNMSCDPNNVWRWAPTPDADPHNYGGRILNALVGASYKYNAISFGVEGGVPAYQYLNGLQLKNTWQITGSFQAMF